MTKIFSSFQTIVKLTEIVLEFAIGRDTHVGDTIIGLKAE